MLIVPVELGRPQQVHHDRGALSGQLASREQPCLAPHCPRTDLLWRRPEWPCRGALRSSGKQSVEGALPVAAVTYLREVNGRFQP